MKKAKTKHDCGTARGSLSIGEYLIRRLQDYGIGHVFGIPGDYVLAFYDMLQYSPITVIGTTREDAAGYAADAYARVKGMGALCVTYCVGGFNVTNSIAQAYAEKSPVVMITGSPGLGERHRDPLLHHKVRTFSTQREIFEKITCAATVLEDPLLAFSEIDRVLSQCRRQKLPVYIEIPRDMVHVRPEHVHAYAEPSQESDPNALSEAITETTAWLNRAKRPVILADVEMHRFGLQRELLRLAEKTNYPVAATILGKSVISELHPLYLGVYEGAMGRPDVARAVEDADCLLMLGTFLTDINLGIFTAKLDRRRAIEATSEKIQVGYHAYSDVRLQDFMSRLLRAPLRKRAKPRIAQVQPAAFKPKPKAPMRVARLFQRLNELLTDRMTVISDVGDSLFGSVDLVIHRGTEFLCPAYYTSMGFAVPAAVGAHFGEPRNRCIVLVGDGAFQMTGMELSTLARHRLNPIILVLNNRGYTTERFIKDGPYNDIHDWQFHEIPKVLGSGRGFLVRTEGEFETAWSEAIALMDQYSILNIHLDKLDHSLALERLGRRLAQKVGK